MNTDYFLKIPGVEGEAEADGHKNEIEVESFSWGEVQPGTAGSGGGAGAAKAQKQDFSFMKRMDKSSPKLMIACATGEHFKEGLLTVRKAGGTQEDYLKIKLENFLISSYSTSATGGDTIPTESFTINFSKLEMRYSPQKPDGSLGAEVKQTFDFSQTKKL